MERVYGRTRFIMIYILSGLFGSLFSFAFSQAQLSAGASGAIFGAIGMQVAYFYKHKKLLGEFGRSRLMNAAFIVGINILFGLSVPRIDNLAHMGGLVSGALLGYAIAPIYQVVDRYTGSPRVVDRATIQSQFWVPLIAVIILVMGTFAAVNR